MALSCFVRRASSSIILLSIRSIGSRIPCQTETSLLNVENRFAVRCGQILPIVRFSTVTNNNIASLLSNTYLGGEPHVDAIRMPDGFPFGIYDHARSNSIYLWRKYQNEKIFVVADNITSICQRVPFLPMVVQVHKGSRRLHFGIIAEQNHISIRSLTARDKDGRHLEEFEECLKNAGINSEFINLLSVYLGIKRKNNSRKQEP